jgi:hypothetical protein
MHRRVISQAMIESSGGSFVLFNCASAEMWLLFWLNNAWSDGVLQNDKILGSNNGLPVIL